MKLKYTFVINTIADQKVAVPVDCPNGKQNIIKTNDTGAFILSLLSKDMEKSQLIDAICSEYEVPSVSELEAWLDTFIEKLKHADVLEYE